MTDQALRPEPNDSEPGDSRSQVRAREPVPERSTPVRPYPPLAKPLPAVGGPSELLSRDRAESLCGAFAEKWDGVACGDVFTVITIAVAACRIAAIVVPLFLGTEAARNWHERQLLKATRRHFKSRSETFHETFAAELAEYLYRLPDNGVSQEEVTAMLSEMQSAWNSSNS